MMTPNQINTQRFNTVSKGGYRTVEVDAFLQKIFQNYSRLYNDNNSLHEKNEDMAALVAEYEKSKSAIAQALIWAQAKADESMEESKKVAASIVAEASQQAENMLVVKKAEAEAYYKERTQEAEIRLKQAQEGYEKIKADAESFSEQYMLDVNNKAKAVIADATEKASSIVAAAFADVKAAREKADDIISKTNAELEQYKKEVAKLKKEMEEFILSAQNTAEKISVNADIEPIAESGIVAPELKIEEPVISEFVYEGNVEVTKVASSDIVSTPTEPAEDKLPALDLISEQDGTKKYTPEAPNSASDEIPDVNSYISKIFDNVASEKKKKAATFSIDYKGDLDDLISEVLDGTGNEKKSNDNEKANITNEDLDDFFGGDEEFE